ADAAGGGGRPAGAGGGRGPPRIRGVEPLERTTEEARGQRQVVTGERTPARCAEIPRRSLAQGAPALADRAELAQGLMGLLQMPPDGLVVLDGVTGPRLEPVRELAVQLRTSALEQAPVGGIPDQVVVEAQCRLAEEPGGVGLDQLAV